MQPRGVLDIQKVMESIQDHREYENNKRGPKDSKINEELFRIKPLAWVQSASHHESWADVWSADPVYGPTYGVWEYAEDHRCIFTVHNEGTGKPDIESPCDSIEHGKRLCDEHFRGPDGIGRLLTKVSETDATLRS